MKAWAAFGAIVCLGCGSAGKDGEPCTVVDNGGSATITCPDGSSATVADGANGENGTNGLNGTNGANGTANKVASSIHCGGQLASTSLWFTYDVDVFSNGDVFVHGAIRDDRWEIGTTSYYAATQVGAATASIIFVDDELGANNVGYWIIALNRTSLVTTITYNDPDLGGTGTQAWTMAPADCVVNTY
jgi:hypothetical protein